MQAHGTRVYAATHRALCVRSVVTINADVAQDVLEAANLIGQLNLLQYMEEALKSVRVCTYDTTRHDTTLQHTLHCTTLHYTTLHASLRVSRASLCAVADAGRTDQQSVDDNTAVSLFGWAESHSANQLAELCVYWMSAAPGKAQAQAEWATLRDEVRTRVVSAHKRMLEVRAKLRDVTTMPCLLCADPVASEVGPTKRP